MESAERQKVDSKSDGNAIISGIEADAHSEQEQIIKEAHEQAEEKRKYTEKKIESILNDAHKDASEQAEAVKKRLLSEVKIELKRRSMNIHSSIIRDIMIRVEKKFYKMIDNPEYRKILMDWAIEAAIGLDSDSAILNACEKEMSLIDDNLISQVIEKVCSKTNKTITLQLSKDLPLKSQGIVLTASDGRTAYNNQVKTRISRKEREIRKQIYKVLFTND